MADNTLTTWTNFLLEKQGHVYEVFPSEAPFLAEMSGYDAKAGAVDHHSTVRRITQEMDSGREYFSGKYVKHPIVLAGLPGGGQVQENSTWNVPHVLPTTEAHINLVRTLVPFSVTVDVERDSMTASMAAAVEQLIDQTRTATARLENLQMVGDGTGKVSAITNSTTSLTVQVSTTGSAPMDVLLPGTVWDILTITTGANPGNGLRRKIASVSDTSTTQTVTFDTAQQASDGNSGTITFASATEAIYIPGSWSNGTAGTTTAPGALCAQGLEQAVAASGTFESIDKSAVQQWRGTDGRNGDTTTLPLSAQMLDAGVRRGRRAGLGAWDFGLGDPAAIDLFKQGLYAQVRYEAQSSTLKSGFSGIVYDGGDKPFPLIKEPMHAKGGIKLIDKASFQLYGDQPGPSFLQDDGAIFRRFNRSLAKEAEFLDRWQLGVGKCNTTVFFNNLAVAS